MGIQGMWWRFEHGPPPTVEELAARLSARCGLPVDVRPGQRLEWTELGEMKFTDDGPHSGLLTVRTLESRIKVGLTEEGTLELLVALLEPAFLWAHLEAALVDLGGEHRPIDNMGAACPTPPAWATRPWSQIGAWRRFAIRYRGVSLRVQMLIFVLLLPFIGLYEGIKKLFRRPAYMCTWSRG